MRARALRATQLLLGRQLHIDSTCMWPCTATCTLGVCQGPGPRLLAQACSNKLLVCSHTCCAASLTTP